MGENPMRTGSKNDAFCMAGHGSKCSCRLSCFCSCHQPEKKREEYKLYQRLKAKYEPPKTVINKRKGSSELHT